MKSPETTKRAAQLKELQVNGQRCLVIDPKEQQVRLRLHWLLHGAADDDVRAALSAFSKVTEVTRERWREVTLSAKQEGVSWDACSDFGLDSCAADATGVPECAVRASGPIYSSKGRVASLPTPALSTVRCAGHGTPLASQRAVAPVQRLRDPWKNP
ncbi:hypothetical protein HPB50_000865 [Hyalomma asiaticum]|uniref:Uncharacterized protein n=1 Tax=Hyalomma asiaticum TaxID=266040 RepID=A0ACB7SCK3_HYAAI|nr:hypothetical protein HPB50_000865 [Hyalomma asiaticum]